MRSNLLNQNITTGNFNESLIINFLAAEDFDMANLLYFNGLSKPSKTLMEVGINDYYLQTDNYKAGTQNYDYTDGRGLKFDLMRGKIDAYNFSLLAADPSGTGWMKLNSNGNPYLQIFYKGENRH